MLAGPFPALFRWEEQHYVGWSDPQHPLGGKSSTMLAGPIPSTLQVGRATLCWLGRSPALFRWEEQHYVGWGDPQHSLGGKSSTMLAGLIPLTLEFSNVLRDWLDRSPHSRDEQCIKGLAGPIPFTL